MGFNLMFAKSVSREVSEKQFDFQYFFQTFQSRHTRKSSTCYVN